MLFERETFLVIAHAIEVPHSDVHRFEKISNIVKQFKLSVSKTSLKFEGMMVSLVFALMWFLRLALSISVSVLFLCMISLSPPITWQTICACRFF